MNNLKAIEVVQMIRKDKGSALPYLIGWLAGVPISLLVLVFFLRSIF